VLYIHGKKRAFVESLVIKHSYSYLITETIVHYARMPKYRWIFLQKRSKVINESTTELSKQFSHISELSMNFKNRFV